MLQETLLRLENLLMETVLTKQETANFLSFFSKYSKNKWIYPGAIKRATGIPIKKVYIALNSIEKDNMIDAYFEVICSNCNKTIGEVYKTINDIPYEMECENCGINNPMINNSILIYKVIENV